MLALRMRYSHFGCNVVHEDVALVPGVDVEATKMALKREVELLGDEDADVRASHAFLVEIASPSTTAAQMTRELSSSAEPATPMG